MDEITLREWIKKYKEHKYNCSRGSMIDMGWYDWFCQDIQLMQRLEQLAPRLIYLAENSEKIDLDKTYVFFKNNCPFVGSTYDDFRICDIETEEVIFTIAKMRRGCYGENFSGWTMWYNDPKKGWGQHCNSWKEIREYFGVPTRTFKSYERF